MFGPGVAIAILKDRFLDGSWRPEQPSIGNRRSGGRANAFVVLELMGSHDAKIPAEL